MDIKGGHVVNIARHRNCPTIQHLCMLHKLYSITFRTCLEHLYFSARRDVWLTFIVLLMTQYLIHIVNAFQKILSSSGPGPG